MELRNVCFTGEPERVRCLETTGKASFNQRKYIADKVGMTLPVDARVPPYIDKPKKILYAPKIDKFDGYM